MLKRFKVTVDGRDYDVTVEDITDGTLYPPAGMSRAVPAAPTAPPPPMPDAPAAASKSAGLDAKPEDKLSPLGGVVVEIHVSQGQAVNEGDKVATIEAMKMKTMVTAHRSGTVSAIHVAAGDGVEAGQALLTIT
ncbi:MAG: acetyl-CoA carboxylase biotin carboxyl carrier protein subunit [Rhodobacterales bacterium]|nr:acetyl-CoA carboxylase biotin carboxyl carrier protein subunit [Rhodobacterales bacterium]